MALARKCHSEWHAKILSDSAAQECVKYMGRLAIVFVQSSAFFIKKRGDHRLFQEHPLFRHPAYPTFADIQREHQAIMEAMSGDEASTTRLGQSQFKVVLEGEQCTVLPSDSDDLVARKHARHLNEIAEGINSTNDDESAQSPPTVTPNDAQTQVS